MYKPAILFAALALPITTAHAQAPDSLGFQGYLVDSLGNPVDTEKGLSITFKLYKAGAPVWTETQSVPVFEGIFDVFLGKVTPMDTVAFNQPMQIGIKVDSEPSEMTPRTTLSSVAFARALPGLYTFHRVSGLTSGYNVIGGGTSNSVGPTVVGATVFGGGVSGGTDFANSVTGDYGTVSGGLNNTAGGLRAFVGGGFGNTSSGNRSAVSGGVRNTASGARASVGGGSRNTASGDSSAVAGGGHNTASGLASAVSGGSSNTADTSFAFVGGGETNTSSGQHATVGGGDGNSASGTQATVCGGQGNTASGYAAAITGGGGNTASQNHATVGGGNANEATGSGSTVGGGFVNYAGATGATVPGGQYNFVTGDFALAAGLRARALHDGSFVWQDYSAFTSTNLESTAANQFLARASGGFSLLTAAAPDLSEGIFADGGSLELAVDGQPVIEFTRAGTGTRWTIGPQSGDDAFAIYANGGANFVFSGNRTTGYVGLGTVSTTYPLTMDSGAHVTAGGVWTDASSKSQKEDFEPVDAGEILERVAGLPVTRWRYKKEPEAVHMGPVAEDFYSVFGLGEDDKHIASLDGNGVALAAIQGLYELVKQQQAEIERLRRIVEVKQ